ncbi:hypothetical protein ERJ75_000377200 [Trypanosoma vivax]|nr:hypothetical protein ERJ75_000377200 [Trypanosoma vivax]
MRPAFHATTFAWPLRLAFGTLPTLAARVAACASVCVSRGAQQTDSAERRRTTFSRDPRRAWSRTPRVASLSGMPHLDEAVPRQGHRESDWPAYERRAVVWPAPAEATRRHGVRKHIGAVERTRLTGEKGQRDRTAPAAAMAGAETRQ